MSQPPYIIDAHTHIASSRYIPDQFFLGIARNLRINLQKNGVEKDINFLLEMVKKQHQDHECRDLLSEMDKANIAKSILLLPDFSYCMKSELSIAEMYQEHYKILSNHRDKLLVFGGVDPRWGQDGITLFEKGIKDFGFSGFKIYPPCGYSPSDRSLYPFYEICSQYSLPVLLHTGPTSPELSFEFSNPELIDAAARDFPGVNFILAHGGVYNTNKVVDLCIFRPNLYLDLGGFASITHPKGWQQSLRELFSLGINHKIIFGTDWPIIRRPGGQKQIMMQFMEALTEIPAKEQNWLFYENIKRITPALR